MSEKSKGDAPKPGVPDIEELINEVMRLMPGAVKSACRSYNLHPSPEEMENIGEEILLLLINNHYHYLLTFDHRSSLKTWLYIVARLKESLLRLNLYPSRSLRRPEPSVSVYI